jgi:predicted O-methyltransferase YrrM
MKNLHSKALIQLIDRHSFTNMIEIGVGNGMNAKTILDTLVPSYPFVYYGIDPYKVYDDYIEDINSTDIRIINNQNQAENNLKSYTNGRFVHFKMTSAAASFKFLKGSIDLIFIDGNHSYEYVKSDLERFYPKLRTNGVMAIHDYQHPNFPGVKKAVDEFVREYKLVLCCQFDSILYFYKFSKIEIK